MAFLVHRMRANAADRTQVSLDLTPAELEWITRGMAKVCLKVESEEALLDCHARAQQAGLESHLIRDSGRTEFGGVPTLTACAIGPDAPARIDEITGDLTLY